MVNLELFRNVSFCRSVRLCDWLACFVETSPISFVVQGLEIFTGDICMLAMQWRPTSAFFSCIFFSDLVMKSCCQVVQNGFTSNGVHYIFPDGGDPMEVLCDMTTDGGGWTVIQRRLDGSVDFYLGWESYKNGFGDVNGEFWLGNDNIHRLTAAHDVILRIDMEDFDGNITYAEYTTFQVTDEADKYRITIGGYSGTAGDSMKVK